MRPRPWMIAIAAPAGLALAIPAAAQRIAYRWPADPPLVTGGAMPPPIAPRLPAPVLPLDDRLSPDDLWPGDDDDPAAPRPPAQNYAPRPAVWKIADRDTTIYLFGTLHALPPGFAWRTPLIERITREAGTLIVESVGAQADALTAAGTVPPPLLARVSPDHRAKLTALLGTLDPATAALIDALPTWAAATAISLLREAKLGGQAGLGADDWLETEFQAAGKPVVPIEDAAGVVAAVNALPDGVQRAMLDRALDEPVPSPAAIRAPIDAWAKGEVGPGSPLYRAVTANGGTALSEPLMTARNAAWAAALAERLKTPGVALFAAGAGHFLGPGNVLELLRRKGVRVERIE